MVHRVRAVLVGSIAALGDKAVVSGIAKRPVHGSLHVSSLGLTGDAQADLRVHGGVDKAVHCYPWAHYERWREELVPNALLDEPGAFGENLSIEGLDERDVCIGDQWRIGSAVFEVSQGRQPCFKLNLRFGTRDMALRVQTSLRAGWYLRVLEPGWIAAGDRIERLQRPFPSHSIADLLALIRDREVDAAKLRPVLELPLTASWRQLFERRVKHEVAEEWAKRLEGSGKPAA